MLEGAPEFNDVREHVMEICKDCVFVGHTVRQDLSVMMLDNCQFIDIGIPKNYIQPRKLSVLAKEQLNAVIQEDIHSSVSHIIPISTNRSSMPEQP